MNIGTMQPNGELGIRLIRTRPAPRSWKLKNSLRWAFFKGWFATFVVAPVLRKFGVGIILGELRAVHTLADGSKVDYGVVGRRVVTTAFVGYVTDQLQTETSTFGDFKFHDSGVGTTAENITDTGIETTDGEARSTGTQTESAANAYRSVGTISYTTTKAITEHGLFNDATAGTLMDRTVFSAINVVNGDSIQFTYTLTLAAGG